MLLRIVTKPFPMPLQNALCTAFLCLLGPFLSSGGTPPSSPAVASDGDADRAALLAGVMEITAPGAPGGVCAFGPQAFAVIGGTAGKKAFAPVVAAARWDRGRVVAFGHNGYLNATDDSDTGRLLLNATRWAGGAAEAAG